MISTLFAVQKYRLGKSQATDQSFDDNKQEGKLELCATVPENTKENEISRGLNQRTYFDAEFREPQSDKLYLDNCDGAQNQMNE